MAQIVTYGEGGFDPSKPNNNIVETVEVPDQEPVTDVTELANSLSALPQETLDAIKLALGL